MVKSVFTEPPTMPKRTMRKPYYRSRRPAKVNFTRNMNVAKSHGYTFKPPYNPPVVAENPFRKKLVKIILNSGAEPPIPAIQYLKMFDIITAIVESNNVNLTDLSMAIRLQKIMVYAHPTPELPRPVVTMRTVGLIPSANDTTTITGTVNPVKYVFTSESKDTGNLSKTAGVGYYYSAAERGYTMDASESSAENFIVAEIKTAQPSTEIYIMTEYCLGLGEVPPVDSV